MTASRRPLTEGTSEEFAQFLTHLSCDGEDAERLAEILLRSFVDHREPEETFYMGRVSLSSDGRGVSRKPGNFTLNWSRLFDSVPDIAVASIGGAAAGNFVRGMIGLYVWNKVWRAMEEPIDEVEASIVESLWVNGARQRSIPEVAAFAIVNEERTRRGCAALDSDSFTRGINRLSQLDCIELEEGNVWLREWVRRKV
jgi:hypothetical protein